VQQLRRVVPFVERLALLQSVVALKAQKFARQELGYAEGAQVEQILGLRLNQAVIGEMSSGKALNTAAKEIQDLFVKNGRKTGALPPLPE